MCCSMYVHTVVCKNKNSFNQFKKFFSGILATKHVTFYSSKMHEDTAW